MSGTRVITGKVRLNYTNLFKPRAMDNVSEEKFSTTLIIPKKDIKTMKLIVDALELATENGMVLWGEYNPADIKVCVKDGDKDKADDNAYKESYYVNASSKYKPGVVDINLNEIIDEKQIYSGCYARCAVRFYPYIQENNIGIGCSIENVQKLCDGEILGRNTAADDFSIPYEEDILI